MVKPAPKPAHGAAPWAAPADPLRRTLAAGLAPERKETFTHHVHAHLDVFVNVTREGLELSAEPEPMIVH